MTRVLVVRAPPAQVDLVVDVLWTHGALGVSTDDGDGDGAVLTASFEHGVDATDVAGAVRARVPAARAEVVDDDETWWDAWRPHAAAVTVADGRVVVAPSWLPHPAPVVPGAVVVTIDPGRTFGSGSHATTRLALDAMARLPLRGARVLDVGCGSGVLSVVAARLGAREVVGVDVDPACVAATAANAAANGVTDRVTATLAPLAALAPPFDVVVANVLVPVFEELAPQVARLATGPVVSTGMLDGTEGRVVAALGGRWRLATRSSDDGWSCTLLSCDDLLTGPDQELRRTHQTQR